MINGTQKEESLPSNPVPSGYFSVRKTLMMRRRWSRLVSNGCKSDNVGDNCALQPSAWRNPRIKPESSIIWQGVASASNQSISNNNPFKTSTRGGGVLTGAGARWLCTFLQMTTTRGHSSNLFGTKMSYTALHRCFHLSKSP